MIQRRLGRKCCSQMKPKLIWKLNPALTRSTVWRKKNVEYVQRTPSPQSSMEVVAFWFLPVFLLGVQDNFTSLRAQWMVPCTGKTWKRTSLPPSEHWWWVMDGSCSMPMTQNIQQRKQSGSTLKLSQSPDLSPTKYLLTFEVKPRNLKDLESFSKDEWAKIPPEMWWPTKRNVLVLSLTARTSPPSTTVMAYRACVLQVLEVSLIQHSWFNWLNYHPSASNYPFQGRGRRWSLSRS